MSPSTITKTTSWMPVTTAFAAPANCSSIIWGAHAPWLAVNDPGYGLSVDPGLTCLPPPATTWWEQNNTATAFSIGPTIVCPQAYTTATTSVNDSSTFVACCPSWVQVKKCVLLSLTDDDGCSLYTLNTVADHGAADQCQSFMTKGQVVTMVVYSTFTDNNNEVASAWVSVASTVSDQLIVDGIQMNGWNFAQSITSPSSPSSSTTSTGSSSSIASTASTTNTSGLATSNPASTSNPTLQSKQSSGLPTVAKASIGVACVLFGAIIVSALLYFVLKHRRSNRALLGSAESTTLDETKGYYTPPRLASEMHAESSRSEMYAGTWRAEMMTYGGHQDRAELPNNWF